MLCYEVPQLGLRLRARPGPRDQHEVTVAQPVLAPPLRRGEPSRPVAPCASPSATSVGRRNILTARSSRRTPHLHQPRERRAAARAARRDQPARSSERLQGARPPAGAASLSGWGVSPAARSLALKHPGVARVYVDQRRLLLPRGPC